MPITKSAKKSLRQSEKRKVRNLRHKRKIKKLEKEITRIVKKGNTDEAKALLPSFYKEIDKTAKTGYLKKNHAANQKSRLAKMINKKK